MMPSPRGPATLHPSLYPLWLRFERLARAALPPSVRLLLVFAWRSSEAQDRLHQIGRRGVPGERIVTRARGGESWHNVERDGHPASLAFDVAALAPNGEYLPGDDEAWQIIGRVAESLGLTWGGRWRMRDFGHCQMDDGGALTLADAMAGTDPAGRAA